MANYPNKPWTHNQEAEIFPGTTFRYDSDQGLWSQILELPYDSDYVTETNELLNYTQSNAASILALVQKSGQFNLNVARGLETGMTSVHKFGANFDIDTGTTPETIWSFGGEYPWFHWDSDDSRAQTVWVVSTDNADQGNIKIEGLDSDFLYQEEVISLTGTTASSSVSKYSRISRMQYSPATNRFNVGQIEGRVDGATGHTIAHIPIGYSQTLMGLYTIPSNKTGYLTDFEIGSSQSSDAQVELFVRELNTEGNFFRIRHVGFVFENQYKVNFVNPIVLQPGADIEVRVRSANANNVAVSASFNILEINT